MARTTNRAEILTKEKAEKQAQKKKKALQKTAQKEPIVKTKALTKDKKALIHKKVVKIVSGSNVGKKVEARELKQLKSGRVIKKKVVFKKGSNA